VGRLAAAEAVPVRFGGCYLTANVALCILIIALLAFEGFVILGLTNQR
jgi:hypothetical protein